MLMTFQVGNIRTSNTAPSAKTNLVVRKTKHRVILLSFSTDTLNHVTVSLFI